MERSSPEAQPKSDGIKKHEVLKLLEEDERTVSVVSVLMIYTSKNEVSYDINMLIVQPNGVVTEVKMFVQLFSESINVVVAVNTSRYNTREKIWRNIFRDMSVSENLSRDSSAYYWFDPITTKAIIKKRLAGCDVQDPNIRDLFPYNQCEINERVYGAITNIYAVGVGVVMGMIDPSEIGDRYRFNERGPEILKGLKSDPSFV